MPVANAAWAIPPQGERLLNVIMGTESPDYRTMYGGGKFNSFLQHPNVPVRITSGPNAGRTSTAAGGLQFLYPTWKAQQEKLGLPDFSPQSQRIAGWDLARTTYASRTGRELADDLNDPAHLPNIANKLSGVWTSLPGGIETAGGSDRFLNAWNKASPTGAVAGLSGPQSAAPGGVPSAAPGGVPSAAPGGVPSAAPTAPAPTANPFAGAIAALSSAKTQGPGLTNSRGLGAQALAPHKNLILGLS